MDFLINLLASSIRIMTPYIYGSIGGLYASRAGVVNMAVEGFMLTGAFTGFVVAYFTGNSWLGILCALLSGALLSLILSVIGVSVGANQVVTGTVISMLASGLTSFLFVVIFGKVAIVNVERMPLIEIPFLSQIPFLGKILFSNSMLTYLAFLLVLLSWWLLFHTPVGLSIRAVGLNPEMATTLGVPVVRVKYLCTMLSGAICSVGGAFLSLDLLSTFMQNMVAGKGYLALAAMVLGRKHPLGALLASLLFGIADALQIRLQTYGIQWIPTEFVQMIPYAAAMLALYCAAVEKHKGPLGKKQGVA